MENVYNRRIRDVVLVCSEVSDEYKELILKYAKNNNVALYFTSLSLEDVAEQLNSTCIVVIYTRGDIQFTCDLRTILHTNGLNMKVHGYRAETFFYILPIHIYKVYKLHNFAKFPGEAYTCVPNNDEQNKKIFIHSKTTPVKFKTRQMK